MKSLKTIVYPLRVLEKNTPIVYSLRSMEKYFCDDIDLYIISKARPIELNPKYYNWVNIAPLPDAISFASKFKEFLLMNDDILFIEHCDFEYFKKPYRKSDLSNDYKNLLKNKNSWIRRKGKVAKTLVNIGFNSYDYSSHRPYIFEGEKLANVLELIQLEYKTPIETAYYNIYESEYSDLKDHIECCKQIKGEFKPGIKTVNFNFNNWEEILSWLDSEFPVKSHFEI